MVDFNQILTNLSNNENALFIIAAVVMFYMFLNRYKDEAESQYEKTPLKEMTTSRISNELKSFGIETNRKLLIPDMNGKPEKIGVVKRVIEEKVPVNPVNIAPYDYSSDDTEEIGFEDEDDEIDSAEDIDDSRWNIEELDEDEYKDVIKALVIPSNTFMDKWIFYITDILLDMNVKSEYYVISKEHIEDDSSEIQIKDNVNMKYDSGLFITDKPESENIRNKYVRSENLERTIESIPNFTKKIDYMYPNHSMDIGRLEKSEDGDDSEL